MSLDSADLMALPDSFLLHLRAERKGPETVKSYRYGVRGFLAWCEREEIPPELDPPTVDTWIAALLEDRAEPATARLRQLAVRRFSGWLAAEDEIPADQLAGHGRPGWTAKPSSRSPMTSCGRCWPRARARNCGISATRRSSG